MIGKNINDIPVFIDEEYRADDITPGIRLKTVHDDNYLAKNKFVFECDDFVGVYFIDKETDISFDAVNIPADTKKIYFNFSYKENITLGGFEIILEQLTKPFDDIMKTNNLEILQDFIVKSNVFNIEETFNYNTKKINFEIDIENDVKQLLLRIKPIYSTLTFADGFPIVNADLREKYNDLFTISPKPFLFHSSGLFNLYKEEYSKKKLTYFVSDEIPDLPTNLDGYDFSNVWLCNSNIQDENGNITHKQNSVYGLKTNIDYENGTVSIVDWEELNISKEEIDNGFEKEFFIGWRVLMSDIHSESQFNQRFKADLEFGDILFSTINYDWAPAEGEINVDSNYKINREGMYITNNEEGFRREISASKDISTNIQTGENTWFLTPQGQWVKLLEAKEIRMGNFHIVEENDEINFYYRGGN